MALPEGNGGQKPACSLSLFEALVEKSFSPSGAQFKAPLKSRAHDLGMVFDQLLTLEPYDTTFSLVPYGQ